MVRYQLYEAKTDQPQYGLDIFIGETDYWNQGIGSIKLHEHELFDGVYKDNQLMRICEYLFKSAVFLILINQHLSLTEPREKDYPSYQDNPFFRYIR
jgi:hypothetical protein